ncbi:alpha/beta fold hydrolase [Sesbania bispinosa]|nr:alpha/beta fold hydrolase [Sesbania bispinosa]
MDGQREKWCNSLLHLHDRSPQRSRERDPGVSEMVNLVTAYWSLLRWVMKPYTVEIEPGTVMRFWVPEETISKPNEKPKFVSKPTKPVVVFLQGFRGDGIMTWQFQVGTLTKKIRGLSAGPPLFRRLRHGQTGAVTGVSSGVFGGGAKEAWGGEMHYGWVQLWWVCGVQDG